jgi:hypothetical protein
MPRYSYVNRSGENALHSLSKGGELLRLRRLLRLVQRRDVCQQDAESGWTPLHCALYARRLEEALLLLSYEEEGRDLKGKRSMLSVRDKEQLTALDLLSVLLMPHLNALRYLYFKHRLSLPQYPFIKDCSINSASSLEVPFNSFSTEIFCIGNSEYALSSFISFKKQSGNSNPIENNAVFGTKAVRYPVENILSTDKYNNLSNCGNQNQSRKEEKKATDNSISAICFSQIYTSNYHTMAVAEHYCSENDGFSGLYVWGHGRDGRLGLGIDFNHKLVPVPMPLTVSCEMLKVEDGKDSKKWENSFSVFEYVRKAKIQISKISLSDSHSLLLSSEGLVYRCGSNSHGQLGLGYYSGAKNAAKYDS